MQQQSRSVTIGINPSEFCAKICKSKFKLSDVFLLRLLLIVAQLRDSDQRE